jgi:hypothetical protein
MHPTHPRRRPWPTVLLLVVTALLLALFAVVLIAPPAGAHALGGVELRTGGLLVDVVGEGRRVPGPSPLPWLAGAALLAMAVVAAANSTLATVLPWPGPRRSDDLDDPDLPGGA